MAGKAGPDISEAGIQLYLDAKNEKSYSGNAVWKDLSGNANSGSMYTGKCLDFSNGWVDANNYAYTGSNYFISFWVYPDDITSDQYVMDFIPFDDRSIILGYQNGYFKVAVIKCQGQIDISYPVMCGILRIGATRKSFF